MTETQQQVFGSGLKSKIVDLALASLFGFFTALGYSYWTVSDMRHEVERLSKSEHNRSAAELEKSKIDLQKAFEEGQRVQKLEALIKEQEIRDRRK